jgi:pimeloyl-ACP methyl ester carboxylesterase
MSFIEINGATIYYQDHGDVNSHQTPLVLIHGSTSDSHTDWDCVIPALAEHYRVFAPDCRGHGQSNNPKISYSFREMAEDVAAFVRLMGYEKAHIVGHSNGGNVALVTLLEHPDIVQTGILQAANAYVTPYLIEREPVYFDADRIEREEPNWMNEMIALHEAANGKNYWRTLVKITMIETMSEPHYSPEELGRVTQPVLSIMGAEDKSNAADQHAQFIASHIPQRRAVGPRKNRAQCPPGKTAGMARKGAGFFGEKKHRWLSSPADRRGAYRNHQQ